ncbi:MAG: hypothetical protein FWF78_00675 [Defluviitaleaceae bacterium]|nr:hypothetical protein [Defluviitaleaceae bacterium]
MKSKTFQIITVGLVVLLLMLLILQTIKSAYVPMGYASEYLPITMSDEFLLTYGRYNSLVRDSFNRAELLVIYNVLSSFKPSDSLPPWMDNIESILLRQPILLYVTTELHSIEIRFHPHRTMGDFAYIKVDDEGRWFTMGDDVLAIVH